jgi:CBS domain-containing protein
MSQVQQTAVLVVEEGSLQGIVTTKDIVLRILAANLDPYNTRIIRVMTPYPECIEPNTSCLAALKCMHNGSFLHLPVIEMNPNLVEVTSKKVKAKTQPLKKAIGLVDILQISVGIIKKLKELEYFEEFPLDRVVASHEASLLNEYSFMENGDEMEAKSFVADETIVASAPCANSKELRVIPVGMKGTDSVYVFGTSSLANLKMQLEKRLKIKQRQKGGVLRCFNSWSGMCSSNSSSKRAVCLDEILAIKSGG